MSATTVDETRAHGHSAPTCARVPSATPGRCRAASAATEAALGPHYACPGVLRPARDRLRLPGGHPRGDRGRPAQHLALQGAAAGPDDIEQSPNMEPGFTRLLRADNLGRELGIDNLWVKDDSHQPDQLLQGPRRRLRAECRDRAARQGLRLPEHRQPRQRGRRGRRPAGIKTVVFIPSDLERPKQVNSAIFTDSLVAVNGNYDDVNKLASEIAGEEDGLGVRQRQRPPLLRRGLQDPGLRDRRAARLATARPDRHPGRLRLAADQGATRRSRS